MALAGKTGKHTSYYPKGEGSSFPLLFCFGDVANSETHVVSAWMEHAFYVEAVYHYGGAITNDPQILVNTHESSPTVICTGAAIAAATATDPTKITIASTGLVLFPAHTGLRVTITADSDDVLTLQQTTTIYIRSAY